MDSLLAAQGSPAYMSDIPDRVSAKRYYVFSSNRMLKYLLIKQFFNVFKMLLAISKQLRIHFGEKQSISNTESG